MPTKTTDAGREYEVDGKRFTWHPLDENDEPGNLADVTIPLRIKLGLIRKMADASTGDVSAMFELVDQVAPGQAEALDEMDVADFEAMFTAWQNEYRLLNGASLGE